MELPVFGTAKGLTAWDRAGLENEHNDFGGHEVWILQNGKNEPVIVSADKGRRAGCPECGFAAKTRVATAEAKKGVCRKPATSEFGDKNVCVNCGGHIVASLIRKCGVEHTA